MTIPPIRADDPVLKLGRRQPSRQAAASGAVGMHMLPALSGSLQLELIVSLLEMADDAIPKAAPGAHATPRTAAA